MKAIILAAGRNTEIAPYIDDIPKCMLGLNGETIIGRQIRILKSSGIKESDIIVVVGYKKEYITIDDNVVRLENDEYESTGNAYSLALALKNIAKYNEDVIILDGDLFFQEDIVNSIMQKQGNILVCKKQVPFFERTGIEINSHNEALHIGKHIDSELTYCNIMKLSNKTINRFYEQLIMSDNRSLWYTIALDKILPNSEFHIYISDSDVYEINNYQEYRTLLQNIGVSRELILLTGASGFLGQKIYSVLKRNHTVIGIKNNTSNSNFAKVDLTDYNQTFSYISYNKPTIIIHTAGIADPDFCLNNKEVAEAVNVKAVENLSKICRQFSIKLIHISTDYVFSGKKETTYKHNDDYSPVNFYGETKVRAEQLVKQNAGSLIIRTPILYGYNDENDKQTFPIKVLKSLYQDEIIEADNIQKRYPVLIDELAIAIEKSLNKTGIMHISSQLAVTKFEWAKIVADTFGFDNTKIIEKNGSIANRPKNVKLDIGEEDIIVSDIRKGTEILRCQIGCIFKLIYKSSPNQKIYGKNVGNYRFNLGASLADTIPFDITNIIDCVVPIPSSGLYYAMGLAKEINKPYIQALIKTDVAVRSFQITDLSARESVIRDKIYIIPELLKGKNIALVDEAVFTGTTLHVVCDMIRACGVKGIYICIPTPKCINRCNNYIMPDRKMLAENGYDMKAFFGVEDIFFQSEETFNQSIEKIANNCHRCIGSM